MRQLIIKIAGSLVGIDKADMTQAEKQIANLLVKHDYCMWDVGNVLRMAGYKY